MIIEAIGIGTIIAGAIGGMWVLGTYNGLIAIRNKIENAWGQIDVELRKRYDLVPNLVETVKGYAKHEKQTLTDVMKARAMLTNAKGIKETSDASSFLTNTLKSLFAVTENYPELKANQNFLMLQEELRDIETNIVYRRQYYNDVVLEYNTEIQTIPSNIIAGLFNFAKKEYFEVNEEERKAPKVQF